MQGEFIEVSKKINVNESEKKGNVERWLSELESAVFETLKKISIDCLTDTSCERTQWVLKWPA